ncbi:MAG: PQQ-dependent sugar dehydrogenase [bacterium]|nr:PQQ-dependent sugar dehydrogenase [bacterium]
MRKILFLILLFGGAVFIFKDRAQRQFFKPNDTTPQSASEIKTDTGKDVEVVLQDLDIPWEVVFLPGGEMLITERPGSLLLINKDKRTRISVEGVRHKGEGGLLGMALHPRFAENSWVYLYSTGGQGPTLSNRVERYKLSGTTLSERKVILENIPGTANHDGGRIVFGSDEMLYVATGDAENPQSAQDTNSLNGKILRVTDDGSIPGDNPFGNAVYSYGHRNVQGLAWDNSGQLWATEHGPSGTQTGNDELNKIEKGKNYGWPDSKGTTVKEGTVGPVIESGKNATWAPSGVTILGNIIYFAGLRGEAVYVYSIVNKVLSTKLKSEYGRLRTIVKGPDGSFYILTNNTDGRGEPKDNDDKLIRIDPKVFE